VSLSTRWHNLAGYTLVLTIVCARLLCLCADGSTERAVKVERATTHSCCADDSESTNDPKPAKSEHDSNCPHCSKPHQMISASAADVDLARHLMDVTPLAFCDVFPSARVTFVATSCFIPDSLPPPTDVLRQTCALLL